MQKITLNLIPDGVPPVVYVNQFDTGREFQISFKEGLSPYNFPSGVVFRINGRKADNHVFEYTESDKWDASHNIITKSGSGTSLTVTIATSEQMTAAAGDAEVQLTFKSSSASNDILGTLNFILAVQEKPDANGDPSESDLPDRVESVNGIGPDANGNVSLPPALGAIGAHNIAPVEPTRIMSTARAAGTQVYVTADDQLYDIISPIGAGGTLTPGTNAIASSISSDLTAEDVSSSFKSSDTDLTLTYAIKVNGFVYLVCQLSNVTTSNSQYIKEVMSSNRPAALTPVMVFSGSATNPVVSACIDKWGQIIIRSGSASVSNMSYYVMAIYRV